MKKFWKVSAAGLTLLFSLGAFAAPPGARTDGHRHLRLNETAEILGSTVPPGVYELRWARERGSEHVRLEMTRGGTVLAAGRGVWTSSDQPYPYEALVYRNAAGANELTEIRFRNSADCIRVDSRNPGAVATGDVGVPDDVR